MSERTECAPGEFCWVELISPDVDASAKFYGDLLGVERERYEPDPEGYWYFRRQGKLVAGLEGIRAEGQIPAWLGYVRVDDVGTTAGKVQHSGGAVVAGPLEVPGGAGSLAFCQDPEGAVFALWQPGDLNGAELVNEIGAWTWNNLMTRDLEGAKRFYGEVFGWEATHNEEAPPDVLMWQVKDQRWPEGLGGLMGMGSDLPAEMPAHWQVYFIVDNADETIAKTGRSSVASWPSARSMSRWHDWPSWWTRRVRPSRSSSRTTPSRVSCRPSSHHQDPHLPLIPPPCALHGFLSLAVPLITNARLRPAPPGGVLLYQRRSISLLTPSGAASPPPASSPEVRPPTPLFPQLHQGAPGASSPRGASTPRSARHRSGSWPGPFLPPTPSAAHRSDRMRYKPSAAGAEPADDNLGVIGRKAGALRRSPGSLEVEGGVDVLDPAATAADEVMVVVAPCVPEQPAAAAVHPADDSEFLEQLQRRVDGGEGDAGQPGARLIEQLLRAQVTIPLAQQPVHHQPLRGRPQAAPAKALAERFVPSGLYGCIGHRHLSVRQLRRP